ncbi:23810_t:CDS:2 [Racocetra persica]|uniref:23810_t:CDS:1 n=1 Tax=Racocetra persica TaxID=160502 RepID=A0ACA9LAW2_9GLOM|nr:23810_t:CDS:2 [Racocetra persica]
MSASTFSPTEIDLLKNGGNAKAAEIWLAKYKWTDFPEPDSEDVDSIRRFMRMKYIQKIWLDESLLPGQPLKISTNENLDGKETFMINPPALNCKSGNLTDNSSNDSLNWNSNIASNDKRKSSMGNTNTLKTALEINWNNNNNSNENIIANIPILPKPNASNLTINTPNQTSNNLFTSNSGQDRESKPKNEIDDLFSSLNNTSTQLNASTKSISRNNTYQLYSNATTLTSQQIVHPLEHRLSIDEQAGSQPINLTQLQGANNQHLVTSNLQPSFIQQKIVDRRRSTTYPVKPNNSSNCYFAHSGTDPSSPTQFTFNSNNDYLNSQNTSKITNPFGTIMSTTQKLKSDPLIDTYQAFQNLSLVDIETSPVSSQHSSRNNSQTTSNFQNANVIDTLGNSASSPTHNLLNSGIQLPDSTPTSSGNPFPFVFPAVTTVISQPHGSGHTKKISFDTAFNDLDPLKKQ